MNNLIHFKRLYLQHTYVQDIVMSDINFTITIVALKNIMTVNIILIVPKR